jgi:hypothetical protein
MGKTTKLNPVRQTDGVKNHVTHSLSKHKIFNLTAMPYTGQEQDKIYEKKKVINMVLKYLI